MSMGDHSLFIKNDGTVYSCGYNYYGQLGIGSTANTYTPTLVLGLSNVKQVSIGYNFSLFLLKDGTVYGCGNNDSAQCGNTTSTKYTTPNLIDISNVKQVSAGYNFSLFLLNDGTVYGCGADGSVFGLAAAKISTPTLIPGLSNVKQVCAALSDSLFLLNDGSVYGCGYNTYGKLGVGDTSSHFSLKVSQISNVRQISLGQYTSLFLLNDGTVYSCGYNGSGQLGLDNLTDVNIPTKVQSLSNVKQVYMCEYHSLFLLNDGTVYTCGYNANGQLGLGDKSNRQTPILIPGLSNIKQMCGKLNSTFLLDDGTIYNCGQNLYGELGNNSAITPTLLDSIYNVSSIWDNFLANMSVLSTDLLQITPIHMYKDKTKCTITCKVGYLEGITDQDKYIKHRVLVGGIEIIPYQSSFSLYTDISFDVPLSSLVNGDNNIKLEIKSQSNQSNSLNNIIKREELYRNTSERTFLKIDGGYNEKYVDKSINKALPINGNNVQTITGSTSLSLDPRCKLLFATIPEVMIPNDQITAYCNVTPYGTTSAQKLFNGILTDDPSNEGIHAFDWTGELLIPMLLTSPYRVTSLMYYTYGSGKYQPFNFSIDGSNDTTNGFDGTWVELKKVVNNPLRATNAWGTIPVPNIKEYKAYRLRILNCTDNGISPRNYLVMNELKLMHQ